MKTRSGTNRFSGSVYDTWRNQAGTNDADALTRNNKPGWLWRMNTPYWFNKRDLPKTAAGDYFINDVRLETPGFRVGGPIRRDKVFYFFNYEEFQLPESRSRTRYLLNEAAQQGTFAYTRADNGQTQTVNLLPLAAARGLTSTLDPTIAKLLTDIRSATGGTGRSARLDLNLDQYDYAPSATQLRRFPTLKADYNLSPTQRLSGTYRFNNFNSNPDFLNNAEAPFPGFAQQGTQISGRYELCRSTLNSVFGKWVNEARYGLFNVTGNGSKFNGNITPETYNCRRLGCQSSRRHGLRDSPVHRQRHLRHRGSDQRGRRNPSFDVTAQFPFEDKLTYIRGAHSLQFGASWHPLDFRPVDETVHDGGDHAWHATQRPGQSVFDAGTGTSVFPGRHQYDAGRLREEPLRAADGPRDELRRHLRPPAGRHVRVQRPDDRRRERDDYRVLRQRHLAREAEPHFDPGPAVPARDADHHPRALLGARRLAAGVRHHGRRRRLPRIRQPLQAGRHDGTNDSASSATSAGNPPYKTDYNNFAPSVHARGVRTLETGALTWLLGSDPVFRGGYSMSFDRLGTNTFTDNYGGNIGRTRAGSRTATAGTPTIGFDGWPVLLRDTSNALPSAMPPPLGENFRLTPAVNESIDIHHPDWKTPIIHQYSAGIQRQIGRDFGIDVRYVGNISTGGWTTWDMGNTASAPPVVALENGFYDEFRKAQANLRANIVAGRGNTFAYTGAPGTAPLPIFMAYLAGIPLADARNQNPANYTAAQFTNSNWYNQLSMYSPGLIGHRRHGHERPVERSRPRHRSRREPAARGSAGQLLHGQPGDGAGSCLPRSERREPQVQRAAGGSHQAPEPRASGPGQLRLCVRPEDVAAAVAARGLVLHRQRRGLGPHVQGHVHLSTAVRPGQGVRHRRRPVLNGLDRRVGTGWPHAVAVGPKFNYGGFRLVGMDGEGTAGHVQVLPPHGRQRHRAHLHVARGRDHELDPRDLQHVGDDGDGLRGRAARRAATSRRPTARTA